MFYDPVQVNRLPANYRVRPTYRPRKKGGITVAAHLLLHIVECRFSGWVTVLNLRVVCRQK
jgi:hypothetical protein